MVLLTGSGHSAHVYDEFAPKLTGFSRVLAISRRGYGASSRPASGYDEQRLSDDVLAVIEALRLERPILVGHSMAGGELTTLGRQHPQRLGGLVYLDALGDPKDFPAADPAYMELFRKLPPEARRPPPTPEEAQSFERYRAWQLRTEKFAIPESELRAQFETNPDGSKGRFKTSREIHNAIGDGARKRDYTGIRVPVLAFYDPPGSSPDAGKDEASKAFDRATAAYVDRWIGNLKTAVPDARVVPLPGAGHYLFLTREAEVIGEIRKLVGDNAGR
jgi:pimeloyl-ACP methyl ester carboxylesterase